MRESRGKLILVSDKDKIIHFIGIGGIGMSGLAYLLLKRGFKVNGSDLANNATVEKLRVLGANIYIGHNEENLVENIQLVVVTSAIKDNNIELAKAREKGLKIVKRAELLAYFLDNGKSVCIAGSHGKTTTTAMVSLLLEKTGFDPTVIIGGEMDEFRGNAKLGKGELVVAEADESDGSFLELNPWIGIITNIEADHLDYYGDKKSVIEAFRKFARLIPADGFLIYSADDKNLVGIAEEVVCTKIGYSLVNKSDFFAKKVGMGNMGISGDIYHNDILLGRIELSVPGVHNLENAMAAIVLAHILGINFVDTRKSLSVFKGVKRRFEMLGKVRGANIIDDYAHHPTEISATLSAARTLNPARLIAVFQPHRYTRTAHLAQEFAESLAVADKIFITDIYSAGEEEIPGVGVESILKYFPQKADVEYLSGSNLPGKLLDIIREDDCLITMGAGNIWEVSKELVSLSNGGGNK